MALSANFGRSQDIRRMLSASSNKNILPFISSEIRNFNLPFSSHVSYRTVAYSLKSITTPLYTHLSSKANLYNI